MARLTRRGFLVAGAGLVAVGAGAVAAREPLRGLLREERPLDGAPKGDFPPPRRIRDCSRPANAVVAENCRRGSRRWMLANVDRRVEGFFDRSSVDRGEEAVLRARCQDPQMSVEVYRSGYYGGLGGRLVARHTVSGPRQPEPHRDETGLISASGWSVTARFDTAGWPTGVYLAKLVSSRGSEGQALMVVRDDERPSDLLLLIPDTTYQAYNYWGDYSLYSYGDWPRAVRVSFDRPYGNVAENQADWYLGPDMPLVRWLEAEGYDVSYAAVSDAHRRGSTLGRRRAWITSGHSEYWSDEMRAAIQAARDRGVHLGVFGANTCYWRVRFEPDPRTDEPDRVMVCYKGSELTPTTLGPGPLADPVSPTTLWRDPDGPDRPENALIGVMYVGQSLERNHPLVVPARLAGDPLWRGAGLEADRTGWGSATTIGQELVGWEWDAVVDNGLTPPGLRRLSETPVRGDVMRGTAPATFGMATSSCAAYRAPSGALVFATGSMLFSWGLDELALRRYSGGRPQGEPDTRIRQLVTNVLGEMGCRPGSPAVNLRR